MPPFDKHPSTIYAEQLASLKQGHAIWIPEGPNNSEEVQLGDVGYIDEDGAFILFFNVDKRYANDKVRSMAAYLPANACNHFDFGCIPHMVKTYDNYLQRGVYSSRTVREWNASGTAGAGLQQVGSANLQVAYSMKEDQGATCWVPKVGVLEKVQTNEVFRRYVKDNIESWHEAIKNFIGIRLEDLIVVRGAIKSPYYRVVSIYSGQKSKSADVGAGAFTVVDIGVNIGLAIHHEAQHVERSLLPPQDDLDQQPSVLHAKKLPIFLRYYKMKQRWRILPKKLEANAGPHILPPGEDPSHDVAAPVLVDESELENTAGTTANQPVDALLDYILKICPDAEHALACDEDVKSLFLGEEFPEDILASLHEKCPAEFIVVDEQKVGSLNLEDVIRRERIHKITSWPSSALLGDALPDVIGSLHNANVNFRDSAGNDKTIRWPHQHLSEKAQQQGSLKAMATSPDGKLIAAGFDDAAVIFWELSTSTDIRPASVHEDSVYALAFSPNGAEIASGSADTRIVVRRIVSDKDGSGVYIDDGDLVTLGEHKAGVTTVVYSPDGSRLVSGSLDGVLNIWDASQKYVRLHTINNMTCPHWISFTPDSKKIVATKDDIVVVWNATDGKTLATMRGHEANIYMADISHDGARVATVSEDQTARVWNMETGEELLTLHEHSAPVWCVAFSPDDSELVTGSDDANIVIADSWTGEQRAVVDEHKGSVNTLAYSKSGEWICVGTIESNVGLLDARSGRLVARYEGHEDKIRNVAFSPDADSIISSSDDGTVRSFSVMDVLRLR